MWVILGKKILYFARLSFQISPLSPNPNPLSSPMVNDVNGQHSAEDVIEPTNPADVATKDAAIKPTPAAAADGDEKKIEARGSGGEVDRWPGWPGHNAFRIVVPVEKVGALIGKKGEFIKKLCEESRAKVRVLDGAHGTPDRIVLISGKEEPEAGISPAMDAALRVFRRVNSIADTGVDGTMGQSPTLCSVRLLVASTQAISLIGKQGSSIKSMQERTGANIRILKGEELPYYAAADEHVVSIQGEPLHVIKALEAVVGNLRKFLVDHSVLPLFEKSLNAPSSAQAQDPTATADPWNDKVQPLEYPQAFIGHGPIPNKNRDRDPLFLERESFLDSHVQRSGQSSLYGQESSLSGVRSPGSGRNMGALVTQMTQTMQIPLKYAEDIIGFRGDNIAYIRRVSGAVLTVQESGGLRDEIAIEIKGTSSQVKFAERLIQDFISAHKEPTASNYGSFDTGLRSSYSHPDQEGPAYPSSSLSLRSYGGYEPSGFGGYGSYRP